MVNSGHERSYKQEMEPLWSADTRITWVATMAVVALALAVFGFFGWRREVREDAETDSADAVPGKVISGRVEIKTQRQPKSFSGIPDRLKKRSG